MAGLVAAWGAQGQRVAREFERGVWTAFSGGGKFQSGTSFATPFIATVIAVAVARGVPPDAKELRRLLRRKVFDLGAPGRDDVFGFGIVVGEPRCG